MTMCVLDPKFVDFENLDIRPGKVIRTVWPNQIIVFNEFGVWEAAHALIEYLAEAA